MRNLQNEYLYSMDLYMDLLGGKWKMRILYHLASGTKRFGELRNLLDGITESTLSKQLKELERDKLIIRTVYPEIPPKVEYSISDYSMNLLPALKNLCAWTRNYAKDMDIELLK
ncbi:MAG: helix-turn-helix domain-containing protein [Peptostreptococcaceae bacterium]|nr:helix-turn-helix domain-containing protein [Peptostreptococcaceae bacterium]